MPTRKLNHAFTLIELSMVLVIIGLIAGGVLAGKSLIKAAEIQKTITMVSTIQSSTNAFKLKYEALPGDIANASDYGFSQSGWSSYYGYGTNGNGDGIIQSHIWASASWQEYTNFFLHLKDAGLWREELKYSDCFNSTATFPTPILKIGKSPVLSTVYINSYFVDLTSNRKHYITITSGFNFSGCWAYAGTLSPADSRILDTKMDDGMPMSGSIRATVQSYFNSPYIDGGAGYCVKTSVTPYQYGTDFGPSYEDTMFHCSLSIEAGF